MIIISRYGINFKVEYTNNTWAILETKNKCWKDIYKMTMVFCSSIDNPEIELEIKVWDKTIVGSKPFGYGIDGLKKKAGVRK